MDALTVECDMTAEDDPDHRRQQRVDITTRALLRDRKSNKYTVTLLDLSLTGFRAEAHYGLDPDSIVWLTIPGLQGLEATIAWRKGAVIGCRFRQPLHPAVFDHIVRALRAS